MIRFLSVDHFKSIASCQIQLGKLNVFVGRNSTGKSNLVEAIVFLRDCVNKGIDDAVSDRHGVDSIIQWSPTRPYNLEISVRAETSGGRGEFFLRISKKQKEPILLFESASWSSDRPGVGELGYVRNGKDIQFAGLSQSELSLVRELDFEPSTLVLGAVSMFSIPGLRNFYVPFRAIYDVEVYNIYPNTIRSPQKPSSDYRLSSSGDNLTSILKRLTVASSSESRARYEEIISYMQKIIPQLSRISVRNVAGLLWPVFEVCESDGKRHHFNVSQISDGALRMLGLLTAIYQPNPPSLLIIEEPEQNLHPGALSLLADAVKGSGLDTQVILTTHSPHFIDHFDPDTIKLFEMNDGVTSIRDVSEDQKSAVQKGLISVGELMANQGLYSDEP